MTDRPLPPCPSCGIAWENHNGITKTCAELQAARAEVERLKSVLRAVLTYEQAYRECWENEDAIRFAMFFAAECANGKDGAT